MRTTLLALLMAFGVAASAEAGEVKVINNDTWFAEGPIWYQNKLFYVEYGRHTVMTWDGQKNEVFWKQEGCGPSAVLPDSSGNFVVTCYDSNSIGRISPDGKTLEPYTKDTDGHAFVGPNDFAPDKKGGIYFTGSGKGGPLIDASAYYITKDGKVELVADDLHNANGVAVSNDGKILYLVETEDNRIIEFDINRRRHAGKPPRVLAPRRSLPEPAAYLARRRQDRFQRRDLYRAKPALPRCAGQDHCRG